MEAIRQALDYRLTLLQAGAGYGKSTALVEIADQITPIIWYQVNIEDCDPLVFLTHLCRAVECALPGIPDLPFSFLENWDGTQGPMPWRSVLDQVINALSTFLKAPCLFIIDDAHVVTESGEAALILDRLIGLAPGRLHCVLSGRPPITLPNLARWRAQGEVLILDQATLTFTVNETASLFSRQYGVELSAEEVSNLLAYTEGWAIALQLAWQSMRAQSPSALLNGGALSHVKPANKKADSTDMLFDMLVHEVFERQPPDVRDFLLVTATLRDLSVQYCNALRQANDSGAMLAYLKRQELFVLETAEGALRYHHIFHDFLRRMSSTEQRFAWHRTAAKYALENREFETTIYHLLEAQAWDEVAEQLDSYAPALIMVGRLDTVASYIDALPPETLHQHPMLLFQLGDLARLHSRFDEAQGWYRQAETVWRSRGQPDGVARALRGQARVYLDTVNPSKAEELLEGAIRLSDGLEDRETQVRLYELLAENKLNAGRVEEAERLRQRADALRLAGPTNEQLLFRVWLRTGRLHDAKKGLEELAEAEKQNPVQMPRAHRETKLILSLIYSFMGLGTQALETALEGTRRGDELRSPFVSAVGHMRQGLALSLRGSPRFEGEPEVSTAIESSDSEKAISEFEESIEISRFLAVPRLRVEANWGLCRAYGYQGDLLRAQTHAQEAIEIATQAGDEWIASLVRLTMGASLTLAARYEAAEEWLTRAIRGFQEGSDRFGAATARLWLSTGWYKQKLYSRLERTLPEVLATCCENGYDFLFLRPSLLGGPDERLFTPLLIHARLNGWESTYTARLLETLGLPGIELHPGYQLRVQTLGGFQVWRGRDLIPVNGWRREKARQLFQVLLSFRHMPLDRDQVCEHLWPEADPGTAQRNFKIALNTLYQTLEPERDPGAESAFIQREGSTYSLRPRADIWIDAEQFMQMVRQSKGDASQLDAALKLYRGEYLPDTLYETWAAEERERLSALFLESADRLAGHYIDEKRYQDVLDISQRILEQDNCWERAYRHLMTAYNGLGDRGQVGRIYQRCMQTLRDELDISPAPETEKLYHTIIGQRVL